MQQPEPTPEIFAHMDDPETFKQVGEHFRAAQPRFERQIEAIRASELPGPNIVIDI